MFVTDYIGRPMEIGKCDVCDVVQKRVLPAGGVVYRSDLAIVFHHLYAPIQNFFVIAPIRHIMSDEELTHEELEELSTLKQKVHSFLEGDIREVPVRDSFEGHFKYWLIPDVEAFKNGIDCSIFTNKRAMERHEYPVAEPYDIMFRTVQLRNKLA